MIGRESGYTWIGFDTWATQTPVADNRLFGSLRLMASGCPEGKPFHFTSSNSPVLANNLLSRHKVDHTFDVEVLNGDISCTCNFAYDAVWLAALAWSKRPNLRTCKAGGVEVSGGANFYQAIHNMTFEGASGHVKLDKQGDREAASVGISVENFVSDEVPSKASSSNRKLNSPSPRTIHQFNSNTGSKFPMASIIWSDGTSRLPGDGIVKGPIHKGKVITVRMGFFQMLVENFYIQLSITIK